jgi:hypothetical protein
MLVAMTTSTIITVSDRIFVFHISYRASDRIDGYIEVSFSSTLTVP